MSVDRDSLLGITLRYLVQIRERRVSASVAQRKLSAVRFHLLLRGWVDVTGDFIVRQALKGWRKEQGNMESRCLVSFSLLVHLVDS